MCERLLRKGVCLHSQSPPQKLCVDDESLDSLVLVRTGAAINEGASQPRRSFIHAFYGAIVFKPNPMSLPFVTYQKVDFSIENFEMGLLRSFTSHFRCL